MSTQPTRPYFAVRDLRGAKACTSSYMSVERVEKEIRHRWTAGALIHLPPYSRGIFVKDTGRYYIVDRARNVFKTIDLPEDIKQ